MKIRFRRRLEPRNRLVDVAARLRQRAERGRVGAEPELGDAGDVATDLGRGQLLDEAPERLLPGLLERAAADEVRVAIRVVALGACVETDHWSARATSKRVERARSQFGSSPLPRSPASRGAISPARDPFHMGTMA